ncbi:hypothetical protein HYT24_01130 [Candidatus Pacearchaeota archaeon]|nr:hypothetical protein [Candidatus Pacearchaeota archaeon]
MSISASRPPRYRKLNTLGEAIEVMATEQNKGDAIFHPRLEKDQIEVEVWWTNGDRASTDYYTIPKEVANELVKMTVGVPRMGYTSQTERTLSERYQEQYYEGVQADREIRKAEAAAAKKEADYKQGIIDADNGMGE